MATAVAAALPDWIDQYTDATHGVVLTPVSAESGGDPPHSFSSLLTAEIKTRLAYQRRRKQGVGI